MQEKLIKVRALVAVYRNERYYRPDDVLMVSEEDASGTLYGRPLFEEVDSRTPEKITSSGAALEQERRDTLASRTQPGLAAAPDAPTGAADVLAGGNNDGKAQK